MLRTHFGIISEKKVLYFLSTSFQGLIDGFFFVFLNTKLLFLLIQLEIAKKIFIPFKEKSLIQVTNNFLGKLTNAGFPLVRNFSIPPYNLICQQFQVKERSRIVPFLNNFRKKLNNQH